MQLTSPQLNDWLTEIFKDNIIKIILSNPQTNNRFKRTEIVKTDKCYLVSNYTEKQVFNKQVLFSDCINFLKLELQNFKQCNMFSTDFEYMIKLSKKDKIFVAKQKNKMPLFVAQQHNRTKNYIIKEGTIIPPLVDMGIFTKDGKIVNSMYDKYRQINRMLEIIDDNISKTKLQNLNIIDFGCGKSYLTFIVYYYLKYIKNINCNIIGLDLKEDVIKSCNASAQKYGYDNLTFMVGDIKDFKPSFDVDIVICLHACDTATDYALFNAIKWNAKMIWAVPCCQHEINQQFKSLSFNILNRYGIAKERFSAILTDIIRCNILKAQGYNVDLLEFIDLDATPKNLLIRAFKSNTPQKTKKEMLDEVKELMKEYNFEQTLFNLLYNKK